MKTHVKIFVVLSSLCLLTFCQKDDEMPEVKPDLSVDSLKILQTNIPEGLYTDLTFISETEGFAISNSGGIVKTTDGGYNWVEISSPCNCFLSKIQFTDRNTGYITGGDDAGAYLLKTTDSGQGWELTDLQTPGNAKPSGMFFLSATEGFISGEKLFRKTTDGGKTWSDVMGTITGTISDVTFRNNKEGYAAAEDGKYLKTADGGKNWQSVQTNTDIRLKKIYFAGSKILAKCLNNEFIDLATGNKIFTVPDSAFKFLFLDDRRCVGIGQHYETGYLPYGDIFLTSDAWETFSQKKYSPQSEALNVTAISRLKEGIVIIIGSGAINTSVIELKY
jgi:hypothetical protein